MTKKPQPAGMDDDLPPVPNIDEGGATPSAPATAPAPEEGAKKRRGRPPGTKVARKPPAAPEGALDLKFSVALRHGSRVVVFDREASLPLEDDALQAVARKLEAWLERLGEQLAV